MTNDYISQMDNTHSKESRLQHLYMLEEKLLTGANVQNRSLQAWFTDEEYEAYLAEVQNQRQLKEMLKEKPYEVKIYEEKLKIASLLYNRADSPSIKNHKKERERADSAYEGLMEYLQEYVLHNPQLHLWFDRSVEWYSGSDAGADPHRVPIPVTSKSRLRRRSGGYAGMLYNRRELKLSSVQSAIESLQTNRPLTKNALEIAVNRLRNRSRR
jgi:hypothetical protein